MPDNGNLHFQRGLVRNQLSRFDAAIADFERARGLGTSPALAAYNIACGYSLKRDANQALQWLQTSLSEGYRGFAVIAADSDLDPIRQDPRFAALVARYRSQER